MKKYLIALLVVIICARSYSQTVITDTIASKIMQKKVATTVILPAKYDSTKTYPVFYFLHWWGGNNESYTDTVFMVEFSKRNCIIVTPDADTSWYINSATIPQNKYEDFVTGELFGYIDSKYRIDPDRQAIGGYSMGGYGALLIGLKHPERFAFIADISGAINPPFADVPLTPESPLNFIINSVHIAFGTKAAFYEKYNVFSLVKKQSHVKKLHIFMAIGNKDEFDFIIPSHKEFIKILDASGIRYTYKEYNGGHFDGMVLSTCLPFIFDKMEEVFTKAPTPKME